MSQRVAFFPSFSLLSAAFLLAGPAAAQAPQAGRRTPVVAVVERVSPAVVNISAGLDRGGLLLAVQRGRSIYNLDFPL